MAHSLSICMLMSDAAYTLFYLFSSTSLLYLPPLFFDLSYVNHVYVHSTEKKSPSYCKR